jgi:hypothetical protein
MGDAAKKIPWGRKDCFKRWPESEKSAFPPLPYPENARFSIKQIAYLHRYCGLEVEDIVARYPRTVSLSQAHLALAHYFDATKQSAIDAEIESDLKFDRKKSLDDVTHSLPSMRETSLIELAEAGK